MGRITKTDEKILSELNLFVQVGATPMECAKALEGKMSRASVYRYYNRFKTQANYKEEKTVSENEQLINELSGKNEELQKELHTQKVVIETLQKVLVS